MDSDLKLYLLGVAALCIFAYTLWIAYKNPMQLFLYIGLGLLAFVGYQVYVVPVVGEVSQAYYNVTSMLYSLTNFSSLLMF